MPDRSLHDLPEQFEPTGDPGAPSPRGNAAGTRDERDTREALAAHLVELLPLLTFRQLASLVDVAKGSVAANELAGIAARPTESALPKGARVHRSSLDGHGPMITCPGNDRHSGPPEDGNRTFTNIKVGDPT